MADLQKIKILSLNGTQYEIHDKATYDLVQSLSGTVKDIAGGTSGVSVASLATGLAQEITDREAAISGVLEQLSNDINGLDATVSGSTAHVGISVVETDGKLTSVTVTEDDIASASGLAKEIADRKAAISGVLEQLSNGIDGLDATVGSTTIDTGKHVAVQVVETDGKLTSVTVTEDDIASASGLAKEIADRKAGDNALSGMIAALDVAATGAAGQYVKSIIQTDGRIEATYTTVNAGEVTVDTTSGIVGGSVQDALQNLHKHINDVEAAGLVAISEATGSGDVLKVYTITQGNNTVGTINIPKDLVVTGGSVFTATGAGEGYVAGEKVLQLNIANQDAPVLIPVKDLTDVYTGVSGSHIYTTVNATNGIEGNLVTGSIEKDKLAAAVQTSLGKADTAIQTINGIPAEKATGFNGAVQIQGDDIARSDSNSTTIDAALTALETKDSELDDAISRLDTRVSGLEAWRQAVSGTYDSTNETLNLWIPA